MSLTDGATRVGVRDTVVATAVLLCSLVLTWVFSATWLLSIPGYLVLLVGSGVPDVAPVGPLEPLLLGAYLVGLGVIAAGIARLVRRAVPAAADLPAAVLGTASAMVLLAVLCWYVGGQVLLAGGQQRGPPLRIVLTGLAWAAVAALLVAGAIVRPRQ